MNRKTLKMVCIIVSTVMLLVVVAGCGNSAATPNAATSSAQTQQQAQNTAKAAEPVKMETVRMLCGAGAWKDFLEKKIDAYNNTTGHEKGIKIVMDMHIDDCAQVLEMSIQSGQMYDLFQVPEGKLAKYVNENVLIPIEELPGGQDFLDKNYKGYLNPMLSNVNGKTYDLPYELLTYKLVYNKDLFKKAGIVDANGNAKPPATWAEVREDAKKITAQGDGKAFGIGWPIKFCVWADWYMFKTFIPSVGHDVFDFKTCSYKFSDFKPSMEFMLQIKKDGTYFPGAEGLDIDPARAQFAEGRIGMILGLGFDVGVYNDQFPAKCDWGAAPLPVLDPSQRYKNPMNERSWNAVCVQAKKDNLSKVADVFYWLEGPQFEADLYADSKIVPFRADYEKLAKTQPNKKGFLDFSDASNSYVYAYGPDAYLNLEGQDAENVVRKIWAGQVGIDAGLADLDKRYNAALQKAINDKKFDPSLYTDPSFDISLK